MNGGLITPITWYVGIEPKPGDRVPGSERIDLAAFKTLKFRKVHAGRVE